MKTQEKEQLFNLLHAAENYIDGYKTDCTMPQFKDDTERVVQKNEASLPISLEDISHQIQNCTRCRLSQTRKFTVPGEGVTKGILILVVGEGPGADEDSSGKPFVGKAGQLLDKMLAAIELSRNDNCFITNIVKCRPPQNREPTPDEITACIPYLEQQIALLKPTIILSLGRSASQTLLQTKEGITKLRGSFYEYNGIPLMSTYHPSALLHDENLKRPAWEDLKKFKQKIDELTHEAH